MFNPNTRLYPSFVNAFTAIYLFNFLVLLMSGERQISMIYEIRVKCTAGIRKPFSLWWENRFVKMIVYKQTFKLENTLNCK